MAASLDAVLQISIHALREEGDQALQFSGECDIVFQSTPSARRATIEAAKHTDLVHISIHALREEGDYRPTNPQGHQQDFNPRPPRGGRPGQSWRSR